MEIFLYKITRTAEKEKKTKQNTTLKTGSKYTKIPRSENQIHSAFNNLWAQCDHNRSNESDFAFSFPSVNGIKCYLPQMPLEVSRAFSFVLKKKKNPFPDSLLHTWTQKFPQSYIPLPRS